jgi:hypothetical protein
MRRILRPSPALAVAVLALFISLSGTAWAVGSAIVPLAKRALVADNAKKLNGQTPVALVAKAAQQPGPASTAAGLVVVKSVAYSLAPNQQNDYSIPCDAGSKAVSGGLNETSGTAVSFDTRPSADGASWQIYLANFSDTTPASGAVEAVCLK